MNIVRQFDVFEKASDYIYEEIEIESFDLEAAKKHLDNTENDPLLYNGYKIEGKIKSYFESLGYKFLTDRYDYFLCCYQDDNK
ncbi:hypothetical protein WIW50_20655 [Flavobacteriaceae bacterium 3-367]|uniref:DUF7683 domain-containing protein n=1 Tax=Eudoraea algarum TaxID=3417568 RepID=UPI003271FBAF